LLTRALGAEIGVEVDVQEQPLLPGDLYLLCSDGLFDMLDETEIHGLIEQSRGNLELAAEALVEAANNKGGYDNVSLILARTV
jgi:protein phosphatase